MRGKKGGGHEKTKCDQKKRDLLAILFLLISIFLIFASPSLAVVRGTPQGEPIVKVGDKAPLDTEELRNAHREGKAILLMFGDPLYCTWCEAVWGSIKTLEGNYKKDAVVVVVHHIEFGFGEQKSENIALGKRYGVIGAPWLYIIDREGIVRHIFVGFAGFTEIEAQLKKALGAPSP